MTGRKRINGVPFPPVRTTPIDRTPPSDRTRGLGCAVWAIAGLAVAAAISLALWVGDS